MELEGRMNLTRKLGRFMVEKVESPKGKDYLNLQTLSTFSNLSILLIPDYYSKLQCFRNNRA